MPIFLLKLSRPALWFPTVWLYLLPLDARTILDEPLFWFGLLYVTFPINLLIYGVNDLADSDIDQKNPRKGNFLFGTRSNLSKLKKAQLPISLIQCPFWLVFMWQKGIPALGVCLGILFFVILYNLPRYGLRNIPWLDLLCQIGYLLIVPLSCLLNEASVPSAPTWLYLFLFCAQSQLIGAVMDIKPDREAGRSTTATVLGRQKSKLLIILIVFIELLLVLLHFQDLFFSLFLGAFWIWLWLDLLLLFKTKEYNLIHFKIFALGSNCIALGTMAYLQWNAILR
ncbi:MAG: UbiA family prenyltransferase [Myxococcota bacterium]|nr:UbiA family prenyltransferase [Myxococcota bacterium]